MCQKVNEHIVKLLRNPTFIGNVKKIYLFINFDVNIVAVGITVTTKGFRKLVLIQIQPYKTST